MGGAHLEREDFTKSAWRDVYIRNIHISYVNALLSFGSSINLTSREKVSVHWDNCSFTKSFGGKLPPFPPPPPHWIEP